jgi:hypothetical protein
MPSPKANLKADTTARSVRPRMGRLPVAIAYSGLGRMSLYELAARHSGLFRKNGAAIIDFALLDKILDELPFAKIKPPRTKEASRAEEDAAYTKCA